MDDDGYMCLIAGKFHDSSLADEFLCANAPCMAESGLRGVRKRVKVDPLYYGVDSDSDGCDSLLPVGILPRACPSLILFLPIVTLSHNQQFKNEIQIKSLFYVYLRFVSVFLLTERKFEKIVIKKYLRK